MNTSPITAPARWYGDPALWPIERKSVFGSGWQLATHVSAVSKPRAWRTEMLGGYPAIFVRDDEGVLRGFHNVCRHRAGPLARDEAGVCDGALTCQYHGWRYALDGRLRTARDFGAAADFDVRDYALFPLKVETWRGLVFASADADAPPLAGLLAPLDARLGGADWSSLEAALRRTHVLECNWKTYVENYLEGYHVHNMHPGLDREIKSEEYRVRVEGRVALHEAPPRAEDTIYDGLWAWVWPNFGLNVYKTGLMVERMIPVGATRTRLDYVYLMAPGAAVSEATLALSDQVTAEDKWITERVQENLNAGVYETGRLSPRHEGAVAAFQGWVREALGTAG